MARLHFNVPFFRPSSDAPLSRLPAPSAAAVPAGPDGPQEAVAGGWHESSHDLRAGVSVSEWSSLEDFEGAEGFPTSA